MGETRVDLLHLLEDLRDAYPGSIEETLRNETAADATQKTMVPANTSAMNAGGMMSLRSLWAKNGLSAIAGMSPSTNPTSADTTAWRARIR